MPARKQNTKPMAAIDIGSNAVRMLVGKMENGNFSRLLFTRVPIALGRDSYGGQNIIGAAAQNRLAAALLGLQKIAEAMDAKKSRFVATAAVRDCKNRNQVVANIRRRAGVEMEVLDGGEEAAIVGAFIARQFSDSHPVLNADTGGGSTDCALIRRGVVVSRATFNIGTARLQCGGAAEKQKMAEWLKRHCGEKITVAASGGSARKLEMICGEITEPALSQFLAQTKNMRESKIAREYDLAPDRARNIIPAARIAKLILHSLRPSANKLRTITGGLGEAILLNLLAK